MKLFSALRRACGPAAGRALRSPTGEARVALLFLALAGAAPLGAAERIDDLTIGGYLRIPYGSTPVTFVNGQLWSTSSGLFVRIAGATVGPLGTGGGGGAGTVTTVTTGNIAGFATIAITNPTTTPAFAFTLASTTQNFVWAGPTSGSGAGGYRALVPGDIPDLTLSKITDKGDAAAKNTGTGAGEVAAGNHSHGNASTGAAGFMSAADKAKLDGVAAGATANDTDANLRARSSHTGTQSADTLTDGTTNKAFTATERTKLAGIATGATANDTDANLRARSGHTGEQAISTVTGLQAALDAKAALAALIATNGGGVNNGGLLHWTQLMGVPAGFADGTDDGAGGGSGTVTSVSSGNLSPLFTVNVATATTTPAFTFTLTNAAQNAVLAGPASGGAGAPSYRALTEADIPTISIAKTSGLQAALDAKVPATRTVNGHALSADVTVTKGDVGLGNADNTSDASKPVSAATQAALDLKVSLAAIDTVAERTALGLKSTTAGSPEPRTNHGNFGASKTFALATTNVHRGVLNTNLTIDALTGFTADHFCSGTIIFVQDGTGSRTVTWPAAVGNIPGIDPTAGAMTLVDYWSDDGGTTIYTQSTYSTAGTGDASTNTSSSVDSEIALFSGTGGKTLKRATGTGLSRVASGVLSAAELSGDATTSGTNVVTLANSGVTAATYGSATASPQVVFDAKGRATSAANVTITPAVGSITGLGTGVASALSANANASGGFATPDGTKTLTNTTLDAAGTGNVLKFRQLPQLTHPHLADGTGATLGTTATAIGYGRATFTHSADEAANYVEYFLHVPDDLDTSVALRARLKILLGGADTATHRYVLSSVSVADSAVPTAATLANAINLDFAGDASGASGDVQTSAWTTLTGWAAALTPGQTWRIRLARDGNATQDASTVNSTELGLVIEYVATQ